MKQMSYNHFYYATFVFLVFIGIPEKGVAKNDIFEFTYVQQDGQPLKRLLDEFQSYYKIHLNYDLEVVQGVNSDFDFKSRSKEPYLELLKELLAPHQIYVEHIEGNNYVLLKKKSKNSSVEKKSSSTSTKKIGGKVVDREGNPLIGVNVLIDGVARGTISDIDGNYSLEVPAEGTVLVFSFIGMQTLRFPVNNLSEINVSLQDDINQLEAIVVVGYGTSKKEEITSAVVQVTEKDFKGGVTNNVVELIKGKVAGLSIVNSAGSDPNATPQVNLRGISTISANNEPLVIIDGVYGDMGDLNLLNPNDIETFNVLKDGASAAIYGTRGSNGVIIVESKRGEREVSSIEYTSSYYVERPRRNPELLDADQYLGVMRELGFKREDIDKGSDTNWIDELIENKLSSYHSLAFSKGSKTSQMRISLGHRNAQGLITNTHNKTSNIRLNFNHQFYDWFEIQGTIGASRSNQRLTNYNALDEAMKYDPTAPVYNNDGSYYELPGVGASNPVALLEQVEDEVINNRLNASVTGTVHITDDLSMSVKGSSFIKSYERSFFEDIDSRSSVLSGIPGAAFIENNSSIENLLEGLVNYNRHFGKHGVKLLGGYSFIENTAKSDSIANQGFLTNKLKYNDIGSGSFLQEGRASISSYKERNRLIAFFGRVNYTYDDRYLFNASVRREGASVFGENNKWGWFPAVSAGWRISNESFMEGAGLLSELKLRAGFGVTGRSQGIPLYQSLARIGESGRAYYNGEWILTYGPTNNPNPDLRWEKSNEFNFGLDFGILDNKLYGSLDVYSRRTKDLLGSFNTQTPPSLEPTIFTNVGTIENKGVELTTTTVLYDSEKFSVSLSANYSYNTNKIISLANDQFQADSIFYQDYGNVAASLYMMTEGVPIGSFYGFKFEGIDANGSWQFADVNKDGKVEENLDYSVLGSGIPKHNFSLGAQLRYSKFDLSFYFVGAAGFKVFNEKRLWYENTANSPSNYFASILEEPAASLDDRLRFSDFYLEKGDFIRLDNVTLGYNFSYRSWLKGARFYATVTNVALITGYSGIDPEVGSGSDDGLAVGWDRRSFYPRSSTYMLGLNLNF